MSTDDKIQLKLITHGEEIIEVNREEFEQAKADDRIDYLLDWQLSDMETDTTIIEMDTEEIIKPYG